MNRLLQALLATTPLLLTPLFIFATAEGILNFGGGEKDILLALPWLIWSVTFAICSYFLIYRHYRVGSWVFRSALVATGLLSMLLFILYAFSLLGVA